MQDLLKNKGAYVDTQKWYISQIRLDRSVRLGSMGGLIGVPWSRFGNRPGGQTTTQGRLDHVPLSPNQIEES
jgi:hypothetical protein